MPSKGDTLSADHLFSINAGTPDMVNLTTLDEESMVSNLQERFRAGLPYTLCGQICVSVNPFRWLPIYEESVINRYHSSSNPFVFSHDWNVSVVFVLARHISGLTCCC